VPSERVAGGGIIAPRRRSSAHLHRSWRATSEYAIAARRRRFCASSPTRFSEHGVADLAKPGRRSCEGLCQLFAADAGRRQADRSLSDMAFPVLWIADERADLAISTRMTRSGNPHLREVKREIKVAAEPEPYGGFVEHRATPSTWREPYRSAILFPIRARIPRGWDGSRSE
jgi:hypothetical protein